jgi:hypothetical protein
MDRFLTNWNSVSPEAKSTLFGRYGKGFSADMQKIADAADAVKSGSKVFANPSGTARKEFLIGQTAGTVAGAVGAAAMGNPAHAAAIVLGSLGGAGSANLAARFLTNPRLVKWLSSTTTKPVGSVMASWQALRNIANDEGDGEIRDFAEQQISEQKSQRSPK